MKRLSIILIAAFVIGIGISAYSTSNHSVSTNIAQSKPTIPSFRLKDSVGNIINLTDLKGKAIFVNLWASWCGPCRNEMPSIEKLYKRLHNDNIVFVMISLDQDYSKGLNYARNEHFSFPVYAPAEPLLPMFQAAGIPSSYFYNPQGEMIMHVEGSVDYNTDEYVKLLTGK